MGNIKRGKMLFASLDVRSIIMKGLFPLILASAIGSVAFADLKSASGIQQGLNATQISTGSRAKERRFPYLLRLETCCEDRRQTFCGGALITSEWILTAGECALLSNAEGILVKVEKIIVKAGLKELYNPPEQIRNVSSKNIYIHPDDKKVKFTEILALLKTDSPFKLTLKVGIIPMVFTPSFPYYSVGRSLTTTGYEIDDGNQSNVLLYTDCLKIMPLEDCNTMHEGISSMAFYCAHDPIPPHSAACIGDIGSPATVNILGKEKLLGIIIYKEGEQCGTAHQVHTNVAKYVKWIKQITCCNH